MQEEDENTRGTEKTEEKKDGTPENMKVDTQKGEDRTRIEVDAGAEHIFSDKAISPSRKENTEGST